MNQKGAVLLFWFCVAFGDPNAVTWFLNYQVPPRAETRVVFKHGQYQIFYKAENAVPIWTCPTNADCVFVPQECR